MKKKEKYIDARSYSFEDWYKLMCSDKKDIVFPGNCLPNDKAVAECLQSLNLKSDNEVKDILRLLLPKTNRLGMDNEGLHRVLALGNDEIERKIGESEYWRRNFFLQKDVWEGLTWLLDLLPNYPKQAVKVIDSYFLAHCQLLSDFQGDGIDDCRAIIRTKYFNAEHENSILLEIQPIEFEWLIEELYKGLDYKTQLTGLSYDEGIDLIVSKNTTGKKEMSIIQCKRYKSNIGVKFVRELNGVVSDRKATKGILISTSEFTKEATKFADKNPQIELIGFTKLNTLLNIHISPSWPNRMYEIFRIKRFQDKN
jgi:restriction system protein